MRNLKLLVIVIVGISCNSALGVAIPFEDDFESYADGNYPSPPWSAMYGTSGSYVTITDAHEGDKSLRVAGSSRINYVELEYPDIVAWEVAMKTPGPGVGAGVRVPWSGDLHNPSSMNYGCNLVFLNTDSNEMFWTGVPWEDGETVMSFQKDQWYKITVEIDFTLSSVSVSVDDDLKFQSNNVCPRDFVDPERPEAGPYHLDNFSLWGGTGYFDNVGIIPEPGTILLLGIGGLALAGRKRH